MKLTEKQIQFKNEFDQAFKIGGNILIKFLEKTKKEAEERLKILDEYLDKEESS